MLVTLADLRFEYNEGTQEPAVCIQTWTNMCQQVEVTSRLGMIHHPLWACASQGKASYDVRVPSSITDLLLPTFVAPRSVLRGGRGPGSGVHRQA